MVNYLGLSSSVMSNVTPLDFTAIKALLGREERQTPPQVGPIKWYDIAMRCASRGCSSGTYIKFQGVPYCTAHVLRIANKLFVDKGITE